MTEASAEENFYDLEYTDIDGHRVHFSKYRGTICLVVNTASRCGLGPKNYEFFSHLSEKVKDKPVNILLFPSSLNIAVDQEHPTPDAIKKHLEKYPGKYEVFQFSCANTNPVLGFLKKKIPGTLGIKYIKWNFTKFLVGREGQVLKRFSPTADLKKVEQTIEDLLGPTMAKNQ